MKKIILFLALISCFMVTTKHVNADENNLEKRFFIGIKNSLQGFPGTAQSIGNGICAGINFNKCALELSKIDASNKITDNSDVTIKNSIAEYEIVSLDLKFMDMKSITRPYFLLGYYSLNITIPGEYKASYWDKPLLERTYLTKLLRLGIGMETNINSNLKFDFSIIIMPISFPSQDKGVGGQSNLSGSAMSFNLGYSYLF